MSLTRTTIALLIVLLIEAVLIISLRWLGWYGTGNAVQLAACLVVTFLPLLLAFAILIRKRFKFGLRSLFAATMLVSLFLVLSLMPLVRHRSVRQASMRLISTNASIQIYKPFDFSVFYSQNDLDPSPSLTLPASDRLPAWLAPFTNQSNAIPPDDAVQDIWLNTDEQCQILADNWERLPSLQMIGINRGVSNEGFRILRDVLPRIKHLDFVLTNDVSVPSNWYGSLKNIRILSVWGEGASRGTPFDQEHLKDIAALSNIEVFMVLGYAFDDNDARALATSSSIKRVTLRGTAVTSVGESYLSNVNRVVHRN